MQASLTVQGTAPLTCMIRDQLYTLGGPVRAAGAASLGITWV